MDNPPYFLAKTASGIISPLYLIGNTLMCSSTVANLEDVTITNQLANQTLMYDTAVSKWINRALAFSSDFSDVVITAPTNADKLIYVSPNFINSSPQYYSINIYGKLNDALVNTYARINLFDSANYDVYNESISSNVITKTITAPIGLNGFRASTTWKMDCSVTLSMTSISTTNSAFGLYFRGPIDLSTFTSFNGLNNPAKTMTLNSILNSIANSGGNYRPELQLFSSPAVYVGNINGDIMVSFSMYEV